MPEEKKSRQKRSRQFWLIRSELLTRFLATDEIQQVDANTATNALKHQIRLLQDVPAPQALTLIEIISTMRSETVSSVKVRREP